MKEGQCFGTFIIGDEIVSGKRKDAQPEWNGSAVLLTVLSCPFKKIIFSSPRRLRRLIPDI
jgi:hypothetical protein